MDNYAALFGKSLGSGGGSGTDNYNDLTNKPSINGTTLSGNKTAANLGLQTEIKLNSKLSSDLVDDTNADNKFVSASDISTWNGKQDAISDLSTIRSGAAAGATAVQPAEMSAALAAKVDSSDFAADQQRQDALEAEDRAVLIAQVDSGAKNLLQFDETSTDNNNVRFTVNADGSITATQIAARTATAIFRIRYTDNLLSQDVRGKILSGCPSGGSDSIYKINIERRTSPYTNYGRDIGNGLLIPDTIEDDIPLYLYIQVYSSATLPLTFKPMICSKAAWDVSHAYQPYRPSYQELYEMVLALQNGGTRSLSAPAEALTKGNMFPTEMSETEEPETVENEKEMEVKE